MCAYHDDEEDDTLKDAEEEIPEEAEITPEDFDGDALEDTDTDEESGEKWDDLMGDEEEEYE